MGEPTIVSVQSVQAEPKVVSVEGGPTPMPKVPAQSLPWYQAAYNKAKHIGGQFLEGALPSTNAGDYFRGPIYAISHPIDSAKLLGGAIVDAQKQQYDAAKAAAEQGRTSESMGHSIAAAVPLFGPIAAGLGEQAGEGDISGALARGAGFIAGGKALGKMQNAAAAQAPKVSAVPSQVVKYLADKGITLTAGELHGPGFVASAEPVLSKIATASKPVTEFLNQRQAALRQAVGQLKGQILTEAGAPMIEKGALAERLQNTSAEALQDIKRAQDAAAEGRAQTLSGGATRQSALSAGDEVKQAVQDYHEAIDAIEKNAYEHQVMGPATSEGVKVTWDEASPTARKMLDEAQAASKAGGTTIPDSLQQHLRVISGQAAEDAAAQQLFGVSKSELTNLAKQKLDEVSKEYTGKPFNEEVTSVLKDAQGNPVLIPNALNRVVLDEFQKRTGASSAEALTAKMQQQVAQKAAEMQTHDFSPASQARSAIMQMKRQLQKQGQFDTNALRSFGALDSAMTRDLEASLPSGIRDAWQKARELTLQQKNEFRTPFLSSMMNTQKPIAGERVITKLMQVGNESDAKNLMQIMQKRPDAVPALKRSVLDYIQDHSPSADRALKMIESRPSLKHIFGSQYDTVVDTFRKAAEAEATPQEAVFRAFLKNTMGSQEPEKLIGRALDSETIANRLSKITTDPQLRAQIGQHMVMDILDRGNVTVNGPFGTKGSYFNPVEFANEYKLAKPTLYKFMPPESMRALDEFANSVEALKLSSSVLPNKAGEISARFKTAQTLMGLGGSAVGLATGHSVSALTVLASVLSPRWFMELAISPKYSKMLAQGVRLDPRSTQGMAYAYRMAQFANQLSQAENYTAQGQLRRQ